MAHSKGEADKIDGTTKGRVRPPKTANMPKPASKGQVPPKSRTKTTGDCN